MDRIIKVPVFSRFNVIGREFPSHDSLIMILIELKSQENVNIFCLNNQIAYETLDSRFNPEKYLSRRSELYPEIIPILELRLKRLSIYQKMCEKVGISFSAFYQSACILIWFNFMIGNHKDDGKQKRHTKLVKIKQIVNGNVADDSKFEIFKREHDSMLDKYPEYIETLECFSKFYDLAEFDHNASQLLLDLLDVEVKLSSIFMRIKKSDRPFVCPNPKCRKAIMLSPTDSSIHCGSDECIRYYDTNSKRENNPKKDWVEDPSQTGMCAGTCFSNRRKLNSDRTCKKCYPEKF